ncbi:MAG: hypothetical protein EZS28_050932, partial [Streblomastix strix]
MTQRHFNQPKQHDKNLEIDSEGIKIDPYHCVKRDQSTTHLIEKVNQENDQDQEFTRDRETIKVQEKLEWTSTEIRMDMKPEANREVGDEESLEEGIRTIKEEDRVTRVEIKHIKKDMVRRKSTTYILSKTLIRQRVHQIGIGHQYDNKNRGECWGDDQNDKWTKLIQIQKDSSENYCDKDTTQMEDEAPQHLVAVPQPKQPVQHLQRLQQVQIQPKQQTSVQLPRQGGRKDAAQIKDDIGEQKILQEKLAALKNEKEQYGISDSNYWFVYIVFYVGVAGSRVQLLG